MSQGILWKINKSEWACPMFTISKPDGSLWSLADLRELNKGIKRYPYPISKIKDMLHQLDSLMFASSLDLNIDIIISYFPLMLQGSALWYCPGVNMNT